MNFLIKCMTLALLLSANVWADEASYSVTYDKQKDTLSFKVENASLKQLLTRIAMQSHIEVLFDDRAEQTITMAMEERPLQDALKNLLKANSHAFRYSRDNNDKVMLIGVSVLPKGDGPDNALPLLHAAGEAYTNAKNNRVLSIDEDARKTLSNQRWQARLAEMPEAIQEKVVKNANERLDKKEKKKAQRKERRDAKKKQREERREKRIAERQQRLESLSPEDREVAEQRREAIKNRVIMNAQQ